MDTVKILRDLWRSRLLVVGVGIIALLAGTAVLFKPSFPPQSRKYEVGMATTSILIDTPSSQVVEISPKGSDTLGVRANLVARLMVDGGIKEVIAKHAGLDPKDIIGTSDSAQAQPIIRPVDRHAPVLTTRVVTDNDGAELPIIQIQAQARDARTAAKLADAAVVGLREFLDSKAAAQQIPNAQRLQVSGLGITQSENAARGPRNLYGIFAALLVFVLGCASILAVRATTRAWRAADAEDALPAHAPAPAPLAVARPVVVEAPHAVPAPDAVAVRAVPDPPAEPPAAGSWLSAPPSASLRSARRDHGPDADDVKAARRR
jgi:hypothetical protein